MTGPAHPSPDSPVAAEVHPSPNHGPRRDGRQPDMLLLHYTGMASAATALARLCDPLAEVSAHYLVLETGRVLQLIPEARRAWHAGAGAWGPDRDINACSIGIEIAHPGHAGGLPPYPDAQIDGVIRLARDIVDRLAIRPERVLGHSDVSPDRKEDPGELFPWERLHRAGIGHWVAPADDLPGPALREGLSGPPVEALQRMLALYGYVLEPTGVFDAATTAVVSAFQRHFRPRRLDGVADLSTVETLRTLIATQPSA